MPARRPGPRAFREREAKAIFICAPPDPDVRGSIAPQGRQPPLANLIPLNHLFIAMDRSGNLILRRPFWDIAMSWARARKKVKRSELLTSLYLKKKGKLYQSVELCASRKGSLNVILQGCHLSVLKPKLDAAGIEGSQKHS
eukprot:1144894-Pelagomonas_calceolata.AAC.6